MKKALMLLSCILGFTSCEVNYTEHKPSKPEETKPAAPEKPSNVNQ